MGTPTGPAIHPRNPPSASLDGQSAGVATPSGRVRWAHDFVQNGALGGGVQIRVGSVRAVCLGVGGGGLCLSG